MTHNAPFIFTPLAPPALLEVLAVAAALATIWVIARGARGGWERAALFALILLVLANPSFIREQRTPLKDTALVVVDDSASMGVGNRAAQSAKALEDINKKLAAFSDLDVETLHVKGAIETDLFRAIDQKRADIPADRLAGIIAITDGQIHDKPAAPFTAPFHALIAGQHDEIDRRIVVTQAPAYGIVGKNVTLTLHIEDQPKAQSETAPVMFRRDNGENETVTMPVGKDIPFTLPIDHPGQNLFVFSTAPLPHELTSMNNTAAVTINGIRDRLRVMLVSGAPHIGERTWRNFLKADPAVDLIHFTILRSPNKQNVVPNSELSLIAFPVRELFATKLRSFDLVILDRFSAQSLVSDEYLENIARYVEDGGALLVSNATDDDVSALGPSPLARILPGEPTGKILTGTFVPDVTASGARHPVTDALAADMPRREWGPWFRQIEAHAKQGEVLMTGLAGQPLLILDRVGKGRVAQFLSDQFWLWSRGYGFHNSEVDAAESLSCDKGANPTQCASTLESRESYGGGPQGELLRRTAHWLVQEPDLDETALRVRSETTDTGWQLVISKQSLQDNSAKLIVTDPQGITSDVTLVPGQKPGILSATIPVAQTGLYHVQNGTQEALAMVGPVNAPEFGDMRATEDTLLPIVTASGGDISWLADHPSGPDIHRTENGAPQKGWNWIGLKMNAQYRVTGSTAYSLIPPLLAVIVLLGTAMLVWRREGK